MHNVTLKAIQIYIWIATQYWPLYRRSSTSQPPTRPRCWASPSRRSGRSGPRGEARTRPTLISPIIPRITQTDSGTSLWWVIWGYWLNTMDCNFVYFCCSCSFPQVMKMFISGFGVLTASRSRWGRSLTASCRDSLSPRGWRVSSTCWRGWTGTRPSPPSTPRPSAVSRRSWTTPRAGRTC